MIYNLVLQAELNKKRRMNQISTSPSKQKNSSGIRALDLIGGKFNLGFSSATGAYQTKLGGYITVLLGLISLGFLAHIISQYMDTESPIVTTSTELNTKDHVFNLYKEDLYLLLAISNAYGFIEDYKRFITPKLRVYNLIYNSTRKSYDIQKIKEFDYVNCDKITDRKILDVGDLTHPNKDIQALSLCPDFGGNEDEFSIADDLNSQVYRRVELSLYPCSLDDQTKCAKPQEFTHFRAYYSRMNKLLTSANYTHPVTLSPTIGDITLNPRFSKLMKFAVYSNKIIDRKYEFFAPQIKEEFSNFDIIERDVNSRSPDQLHCSEQQVALWKRGGCSELLSVVYEVKREIFIVKRNYKRIVDVFAEFGGIMKLLTAAVFLLYSWYNQTSIRSSIIETSFGIHGRDGSQVKQFIGFIQKKGKFAERNGTQVKIVGQQGEDPSINLERIENPNQQERENLMKFEQEEQNRHKKRGSQSKLVKQNPEQGVKKKKKREESQKVSKILTEFARNRTNADDLINKLNFVEFLQMIFLDKNLKKLLPLLLINKRYLQQRATRQTKIGAKNPPQNYHDENENNNSKDGEQKNKIQQGSSPITDNKNKNYEKLEKGDDPRPGLLGLPPIHPIRDPINNNFQESNRGPNQMIWPRLALDNSREPKSLRNAYNCLKTCQAYNNCPLKACIKNYVVGQIGDFFERKQSLSPVLYPQDPERSTKSIIVRSYQEDSGSLQMANMNRKSLFKEPKKGKKRKNEDPKKRKRRGKRRISPKRRKREKTPKK